MLLTLIVFVLASIPIPTTYKFELCRSLKSTFLTAEILFAATLLFLVWATYATIIADGMNMTGVKGYILSLIPTIPIPIFIWIIKQKLFREKLNKTKKLFVRKPSIGEGAYPQKRT